MNDLLYWIWLSLSCTQGSESFIKLFERFGGADRIYASDENDIAACIGTRSPDYTSLTDKKLDKAREILDFCRNKNVGILLYSDERFPSSLKKIPNPPVLLYYRGVLPNFSEATCISVVGTRRVSDYGRRNAFKTARDLAKAGAVIVSGMAIGIDGVALAAALSEGATTVAVIGSGIDVCYPEQHKRLAREIVKTGCVFTEYPPGTPPYGPNFPIRNRLISGLSVATVVIEGRERSGALITAACARKQERLVYALPGNVGNAHSEATNLLIKNGARSFTCADDIVRDFDSMLPGKLNPFKMLSPSARDMNAVLREFSVAAVAPSDNIFRAPRSSNVKPKSSEPKEAKAQERDSGVARQAFEGAGASALIGFDKAAVALYKRIPLDAPCAIETLVDENNSLRDVMRLLLKLEMARFVVMLPGEQVRRNSH